MLAQLGFEPGTMDRSPTSNPLSHYAGIVILICFENAMQHLNLQYNAIKYIFIQGETAFLIHFKCQNNHQTNHF